MAVRTPRQRNPAKEKCLPATIARTNGSLTTNWKPSSSIAFITALFGDYEKSLKEPAIQQGASPKFIAFCDESFARAWLFAHGYTARGWTKAAVKQAALVPGSSWHLDWTPYHKQYVGLNNTKGPTASWTTFTKMFKVAKWYKLQFFRIPRLRRFERVVWMDATVALCDPQCARFAVYVAHSLTSVHFHPRNCSVLEELRHSTDGPKYFGQPMAQQVASYLREGQPERYGMWLTCFTIHDMKNIATESFLDTWYTQTVKWSLQDQLSFPYAAWKHQSSHFSVASLLESDHRKRGWSPGDYRGMPCAFVKVPHGSHATVPANKCQNMLV